VFGDAGIAIQKIFQMALKHQGHVASKPLNISPVEYEPILSFFQHNTQCGELYLRYLMPGQRSQNNHGCDRTNYIWLQRVQKEGFDFEGCEQFIS
jgi:hypothetical protein